MMMMMMMSNELEISQRELFELNPTDHFHRCIVHFAETLNQHTNQYTYIKLFILTHLKSLQHVSILRSSSGSYAVPC